MTCCFATTGHLNPLPPQAAQDAVVSIADIPHSAPWQAGAPVFSCFAVPRLLSMLRPVADMLRAELRTKQEVAQAMAALLAAAAQASNEPGALLCARRFLAPKPARPASPLAIALEGTSSVDVDVHVGMDGVGQWVGVLERRAAALLRPGAQAQEGLQAAMSALLATWMLAPRWEDTVADEALAAVTEDMVGF